MLQKDHYIRLCAEENDLPLFHQNWWLDIVCKSWDAVIVKKGDNVAGVWPFNIEKKLGINISRNPSLTPYLGPHVFFPKNLKESKWDEFEHETISGLIRELPAMKVWHTACRPGLKQAGLFKEHHFQTTFSQTFIMDLQEDEDTLLKRLHEEFRRSTRKVSEEMTITNEPNAIPLLYDFQVATLSRKEKAIGHSLATIQQLFNACNERNATALWVARKNNEVQGMVWHTWDGTRAYYLAGAKNPQVRDNHAMPALVWHAIKHSKSLGKTSFDFEGSMVPGIERFFRNFGGKRELYPVLQKNDSLLWRAIRAVRP